MFREDTQEFALTPDLDALGGGPIRSEIRSDLEQRRGGAEAGDVHIAQRVIGHAPDRTGGGEPQVG